METTYDLLVSFARSRWLVAAVPVIFRELVSRLNRQSYDLYHQHNPMLQLLLLNQSLGKSASRFYDVWLVRPKLRHGSVPGDNFNARLDNIKRMNSHWAESIGERTGLGKISRMRGTLPSEINSLDRACRVLSPGGQESFGSRSGEENTC